MNAVAHDAQLAPSPADRIVTELLTQGRLKEADLQRARQLQRESGGELLVLLARLGLVSERDHAEACAKVLGLRLLAARDLPEHPPELVEGVEPVPP